jgi:hypothetical protein
MAGTKPSTGKTTEHADNKQFERGSGVKNVPLKKSPVNAEPPNQMEAKPRGKSVPMAPKINEGTNGQADGAKRVISTEAKPAGRNSTQSTYRAPRGSESSNPVECGYTKLGKV